MIKIICHILDKVYNCAAAKSTRIVKTKISLCSAICIKEDYLTVTLIN